MGDNIFHTMTLAKQITNITKISIIGNFNQIVEAYSDKLDHGPISAHMKIDGHKNVERWWFKS